jgi:hypothetical protein
MLDQLADFQAHRDLLESDKRALLDDVKIPAEVEMIVKAGTRMMAEVESTFAPMLDAINAETQSKLAEIVIPEEIKAQLALIDASRRMVNENAQLRRDEIAKKVQARKSELQAEIEAQTREVYASIAARKNEIEAEFAGKSEAVDDNIKRLTDAIKAEVKTLKKSVKADHFHAVYVSGRITWNTDKMEAWRQAYPFLDEARKEGEPSITLRRI